ncbi:MAG: hypothetical protein EB078_02745 [Proteobacteria bacterium]|nr:hypothetical protein [Pseudomonadota bacterium]
MKILETEPESRQVSVAVEGQPFWGSNQAPVTIVEFLDFECPFCAVSVRTLERIKQEYGPEKVRIVFHHFPLPNHPRAIPASLAASCANVQGKFWEMHNLLFENQGKLKDSDLKGYAKKLRIDSAKFADCYDKKAQMQKITRGQKEGEKVGVFAVPSYVINGILIQGIQPFEQLKETIDRALKKG